MYRSWSSCSTPELWWSMCCTVWSFVSMLPHLSRRATSFGPFVMEGRTAHLSKDRILHGVVDRQGAGCGGGWLESFFRWPELPRDISPEMPSGIFVCYHTFCGKLIFRGLLGGRSHQAAGLTKRRVCIRLKEKGGQLYASLGERYRGFWADLLEDVSEDEGAEIVSGLERLRAALARQTQEDANGFLPENDKGE